MRLATGQAPVVGGNAAGARERAFDEAIRQAVEAAINEVIDPATRAAQAKAIKVLLSRPRVYVPRYRTLEEGESNGVYTVRASGADIWGARDEFRFVYARLSGDGEVVARIDALSAADSWTKAGVMIRQTLRPSSRFAYALVSGGRFAWNAFVFDQAIADEIAGVWREDGGVRQRSTYDLAARRIDLELENGASVPLWWIERDEWEAAIAEAGLEIEALYGWFDRRPFDAESPEFVYVARRPA